MRRLALVGATAALLVAIGSPAWAHPLGNYSINHHVGVHITPEWLEVTLVVDLAEIPAFQERAVIDRSRDGVVSPAELEDYAPPACAAVVAGVMIDVDGSPPALEPVAASVELTPGQGGLDTLRLDCGATAAVALSHGAVVSVVDGDRAERAGWREVVVTTDGVTVDTDAPAQSPSNLLRTYPPGAVQDRRTASIVVTAVEPDWSPAAYTAPAAGAPGPVVSAGPVGLLAGLISGERSGAAAVVVGLMVAFGLGIAHALAPGHGKTLMAAYLVASHGRARHAAGLGLAVAVSHTIGVAALGVVTLAASRAFRPEVAYPYLSLVSAGIVLVIGSGLLWRAGRTRRRSHPGHGHDHSHMHGDSHDHGHDHGHGHDHHHGALPSLTWRSLAALGLAGGLVPSASAVVLLLGAVGLGRIELGLAMVALFGAGMATALVGAGLAVLGARRAGLRLLAGRSWGRRLVHAAPLVMGALVALAGLVMTVEAIRRIAV